MEEFVRSKRCSKCHEVKSLMVFNRSAKSKDGYQWFCKECAKVYNKKRYVYDAELSRMKHLKRTYGLTSEEYQELFTLQNGACAAWGQPETANDPRTKQIKNLQVDHCHTTGKVKALLCKECNNALGLLHDDPTRIRLLLQYAELHHHSSYISSEGASE
jgi:RNase P subunit RPR2